MYIPGGGGGGGGGESAGPDNNACLDDTEPALDGLGATRGDSLNISLFGIILGDSFTSCLGSGSFFGPANLLPIYVHQFKR